MGQVREKWAGVLPCTTLKDVGGCTYIHIYIYTYIYIYIYIYREKDREREREREI